MKLKKEYNSFIQILNIHYILLPYDERLNNAFSATIKMISEHFKT